jgi:hypothetical protein
VKIALSQYVKVVVLSILSVTSTSICQASDEGLDASLSGGYMASFLSEEATSSYMARLTVDGPIGGIDDRLRAYNRLDLGLLPGDGSIQSPDTYNSVEYTGRLSFRVGETYSKEMDQKLWTSFYIEGGFGALRKKSENPVRKDSPVWMGGGILIEERVKKSYLSVGLYADQRLDGLYQPTVVVSGGIELPLDKILTTDKIKMSIVGDAVLGIVDYGKGPGRQVRVGVMLGI